MTPLQKALQDKGKVNYCDECEQFQIVGNAAYCKVDGKLIHPIMIVRGQGRGPAYNCKKREKITNADRIRAMSDEEMASLFGVWVADCDNNDVPCKEYCSYYKSCGDAWLAWLKAEVSE